MAVLEEAGPSAFDEPTLVAAARAGDAAAFASLYEAHRAAVLHRCRSILGNDDDAADATQETFLRAWRALGSIDDERRFGGWLRAIATNVSIDVLRRRPRTAPVDDLDEAVADGDDLAAVVAHTDALTAALGRLTDRHREVLWMREWEGWTYERIASEQHLDLPAVKSLLWRARQSLRREFLQLSSPEGRLAGFGGLLGLRLLRRAVGRPWEAAARTAGATAELGVSVGLAAALTSAAVLPMGAAADAHPVPPPVPTSVVTPVAPDVQTPAAPSIPVASVPPTTVAPPAVAPAPNAAAPPDDGPAPPPAAAPPASGSAPEPSPPAPEPVLAAPPTTVAPAPAAPPPSPAASEGEASPSPRRPEQAPPLPEPGTHREPGPPEGVDPPGLAGPSPAGGPGDHASPRSRPERTFAPTLAGWPTRSSCAARASTTCRTSASSSLATS